MKYVAQCWSGINRILMLRIKQLWNRGVTQGSVIGPLLFLTKLFILSYSSIFFFFLTVITAFGTKETVYQLTSTGLKGNLYIVDHHKYVHTANFINISTTLSIKLRH